MTTRAELPDIGKISPEIFDEMIFPRLGAARPDVRVGPRHGVDFGVLDIGGGRVMAITTDPFFVMPAYGWRRAAWFAVHILASDAACSGLPPAFITIDLNLPMGITRDELDEMWATVHAECESLGMAIVAGHTARYEGCNYPMVGGATVMSVGPADAYVTPAMARPGDALLITKGPAIEAAGLLAATFPERTRRALGADLARKAGAIFEMMTVVPDCRAAVSAGVREDGVTAMHDATECGVWGGIVEIAQASKVGVRVELGRIPVLLEVAAVCREFGIDPFSSISEGTLVLTSRPHRADAVLAALAAAGVPAARIGEIVPAEHGLTLVEEGRERPLVHPRVDPFWGALREALVRGDG